MRWAKVGRHTIDLRRVYRLTEGGEEIPAVTICFVGGSDLDLTGAEATEFLGVFGRYIATRSYGLPPPPERDGGVVVVPQYYRESGPGPAEPPGVEGPGVREPNVAGDHQ